MRTRRSLVAAAAATLGWWQVVVHGRGGSAAEDDAGCVEPDRGPMQGGCAQPPPMVLRVPDGGSQEAALGTSCWATAGSACCVDMIGPVYPACPLAFPAGEIIEVDFAGLGVVSDLTIELRRDPAGARGGRRGRARRGSGGDATWRLAFDRPDSPLRLPAFLPPGAYVFDLFAYADGPHGSGDTTQGFRIDVEPRSGEAGQGIAATPVADALAEGTPAAAE